jgi:hypothetical protein
VSNRKIRIGRPEDWGRLALWSATYFTLLVLQATGTDLVLDVRAGTADWLEVAVVLLVGLLAAIPIAALLRLARRKRQTGFLL